MKGIVLGDGGSTRLYPMTPPANKQLLPASSESMAHYPLTTPMLARCRDIPASPARSSRFGDRLRQAPAEHAAGR